MDADPLAHDLREASLRPGDTVAVLMENNEHVHAVMWAARRSGPYYAMINTHLTAAEAAYIVMDSGAKALVASRAMRAVCVQLDQHVPEAQLTHLVMADAQLHHVIISGGVNIYPQEAEDLLITHPKVLDAAVFGIPDTELGQRVKAVVQTVDPAGATDALADELIGWLRERLAGYKCPRSISFEESLPRTDTGKLYKRELVTKYSTRA